jgi:hypothetical protein
MSVAEAQDTALTATSLLALDEEKVVEYLNRNRDASGGFDISGLIGVRRLEKGQRSELARRLR